MIPSQPPSATAAASVGRPLRFCMITTFYPPYSFGGDAVFVQRLSNELVRRGHHVEVVHCVDAYRIMARREPVRYGQDGAGVIVHSLRSRLGPLSPLATQQAGQPWLKSAEIRRILDPGFDIIHFHNVSLVGGPGILRFGSGLKLYTIHEHWLVCPTHVLFKNNRAACTRRDCLTCQLVHGRPPQWWRYSGLLPTMVSHVDAFLAPSRFVIEKHRDMGLDLPMVHLPHFLPETADPASVAADESVSETGQPYFLFLGRLEKLKGVHTLIPLFRRYGKADLLLAGRGGYEPELRRLAAGIPNIRFLGQQPAAQVRTLLRGAVALIVPSICFEVFPNVTLEAFSQGTPAIVRNIGGLPEQIEQSGGGLIYDTDEELVSAMDRLLADRAYRDALGRRGYAACRAQWSPDVHLGRYLGLIHDLAGGAGL
jgi:glycosyltransferase involved in cell wall biosynthesis